MNGTFQREITLTRKKAAEYLGVSVPTLARWASQGNGPGFIVLGGKARYRIVDLDGYIETCRRPCSEQ